MLDKLVLHIPFRHHHMMQTGPSGDRRWYMPLERLPVSLVAGDVQIDQDGNRTVSDLRTKFESLPSSYSGMAFKVYNDGTNSDPYVAIKCSPAKLLQGHNLYGFDCIKKAALNMLSLLSASNPALYNMLNVSETRVSEIDITYSAFVPDRRDQMLVMDHLRNVSNGQTKARGDAYQTTCYFGAKQSRLKQLKLYLKFVEMMQDAKKMERNGFKESARIMRDLLNTDYAKSAMRFEATLKARWLERRGVPTKLKALIAFVEKHPDFYTESWSLAWGDVFEALEGQELTVMNDDDVYKALCDTHFSIKKNGDISLIKPNRLFAFYQTLKAVGYDAAKAMHSKSQFYQNVSDLTDAGISKATLQNLDKSTGAVVMQLSKLIRVDFGQQLPADYVEPRDLFAA